jgi:steroid 5-alpha reductase family enzyme
MLELTSYLWGLAALLGLAVLGWAASVAKGDAGLVDSLWSLFFLLAALVYAATVPESGSRAALVLTLVALWAVRLSAHVTWRNWGQPEDRRYRAIRERNEPGFRWKSLYLVFGLQATLAWVLSVPLLAAIASPGPLNALDYAGVALWLSGMLFEAVGDWQLARFKARPENAGRVMDRGLWRYTRHPNYFGEACRWWGFFLIAAAGGGWWTVFAPVLMTYLLLRVSGVALLEQDIGERRPGYREYVARTNAFLPGPPGKP